MENNLNTDGMNELETLNYYLELSEKNPQQYLPQLAESYINAGAFYDYHWLSKQADMYFIKEEEIGESNYWKY